MAAQSRLREVARQLALELRKVMGDHGDVEMPQNRLLQAETSALPPKADIERHDRHVRFVPLADKCAAQTACAGWRQTCPRARWVCRLPGLDVRLSNFFQRVLALIDQDCARRFSQVQLFCSAIACLTEYPKTAPHTGETGRFRMPKYLVLLNLTDQGAKTVKEIPNKRDQSRETAKKFGVERKQAWMTFGPYDFVHLYEAPNDDAMAKFVLKFSTLAAFGQRL